MALVAHIIEQGPRNHIVKLEGTATDSGVAFDATTLVGTGLIRVSINKIWSSIPPSGTVLLDWQATANTRAITLNATVATLDMQVFAGINNNSGAGRTGSLLITGTGTGDWTVILWLVKH